MSQMPTYNNPFQQMPWGLLGASILANNGNIGKGIQQGLLAHGQYQKQLADAQAKQQAQALQQMQLKQLQAQMQQAQQRQQARQAFIGGLSPEQQAVARAYPDQFAAQYFAKPQKGTDDMREYQQAVSQGYKGSFMDYMKAIKQAGAVRVNTAETRLPTEQEILRQDTISRAENARKRLGEIIADSHAGYDKVDEYQRALKLLETVNTGTAEEAKLAARKLAKAFGFDVDVDSIAKAEELGVLLGNQVMERVGQTKGAVSEKEMELFRQYSANFGNTPEGNRQILNFRIAKAQRDIKLGNLIRRMQKEGKTSLAISNAVDDYLQKNSLADLLRPQEGAQQGQQPQPAGDDIDALLMRYGGKGG